MRTLKLKTGTMQKKYTQNAKLVRVAIRDIEPKDK